MAKTQNFETVAEVTVGALKQMLQQAWKSGGDTGAPGVIPEFEDIPPGTAFGPYLIQDGQVQIPQNELDLTMATDVNGVQLKFGLHIQLDVQNPPVPSIGLITLTADVSAKVAVGAIGAAHDIGVLLGGLVRSNVTATLTSGDPIAANLTTYITEFVHKQYADDGPAFPHTVDIKGQNLIVVPYTVDMYVELFDDPNDPAHQITVSLPPGQIQISVPLHLRIYHIVQGGNSPFLDDPMGIEARMVITAPFAAAPGTYTVNFPAATVATTNLVPAPAPTYGQEGAHYSANKPIIQQTYGVDLDSMISLLIQHQGQLMAQQLGTKVFTVPTVSDIEQAIGDMFTVKLQGKGSLGIWTPSADPSSPLQVNDVTTLALADSLVLAINAEAGANVNGIVNFIPAGLDFAVAVDAPRVLAFIDQAIHRPVADGGFGPTFPHPPMHFHNVNGHDADLTKLDRSLKTGAIHLEGDITVINAILGSIDVDASFSEDCGLKWQDNVDGTQQIIAVPGDPDVDLSLFAWIISFLIGFITFGLVGGIIGIVVIAVVEAVAQSIGGPIVRSSVTNEVTGIGAWPKDLAHIGTVTAHFQNPVDISSDGLMFSGTLIATSKFALTAVVPANAQGPYSVVGGVALTLSAGATHPSASYGWLLGDGAAAATPAVVHTYGDDGFYIAKFTLVVGELGGATSRHFAAVQVLDTPAIVNIGPDRTVNEGEVVPFTGMFTDQQWPDTHTAVWNWDDYQGQDAGVVTETHNPPVGQGMVKGNHAWGDSGSYIVNLVVTDDGGAIGRSSAQITVLNLPPTVETGQPIFAYPDSVITLEGHFTDPGWLDRHVGQWDFGDGTPIQVAIIHETHNPPIGKGVAVASHVYERLGVYVATCTVIDDDGGVGTAITVVHVVDVANARFERGFRRRLLGTVANDWEPYRAAIPQPFPIPPDVDEDDPAVIAELGGALTGGGTAVGQYFYPEEFCVHRGERSQGIRGNGPMRAGILQLVGANPGWDYQISAWYTLSEQDRGLARLGVDPQGGVNPDAGSVVWIAGQSLQEWAQLAVRVNASDHAITIFLEALGTRSGVDACFDDVALVPIQPFCPVGPKPQTTCVDFTDLKPETQLPPVYDKNGFRFSTMPPRPLIIVDWLPPPGKSKLQISGELTIDLPWVADWVQVQIAQGGGQPFEVVALDAAGSVVGQITAPPQSNVLLTLEITAPGVVRLRLPRAPREGVLYQVCARRATTTPSQSTGR